MFPHGLPPALDITSIDDYYMTVAEHREWYTTKLYPLLSSHQRVFLVPGSYGALPTPAIDLLFAAYSTIIVVISTHTHTHTR